MISKGRFIKINSKLCICSIVAATISVASCSTPEKGLLAGPTKKSDGYAYVNVVSIPYDQPPFHIDAVYTIRGKLENWEYYGRNTTCETRIPEVVLELYFTFKKAGFPLPDPHLPQQPANQRLPTISYKGYASDCAAVIRDREAEKYASGTGDQFPTKGLPTLLPKANEIINSPTTKSARDAYVARMFDYIRTLPIVDASP